MNPPPWIKTVLGVALVAGVAAVGAIDGQAVARDWSRMGPAPPGTELADFAVRRLDGTRFDQSDLQGRVSIVTFWATWCPACGGELEDLDELDEDYRGRDDVQFLAVNWEGGGYSPAQRQGVVEAFRTETGLGLPVAIDTGAMAKALRVGAIPHTLVVDQRGVVRHVYPGRVRGATLADDVSELLAER